VSALKDGFASDVLEYARHLAEHDPQPRRGATVLGTVLLQLQDHGGAREVMETRHRAAWRGFLSTGEPGACVCRRGRRCPRPGAHLARTRTRAERGNRAQLDDRHGAGRGTGRHAGRVHTAAALPGSWRALLWLARHALERGDLADATRLYETALARATPAPADLLMQLSGDLGNRGHTDLLVKLTQPRFDLLEHGLIVGNNLLRAYVELGMFAEARKLLEQLYSRQRPDWREQLIAWEEKLDEAEKRYGEVTAPVEVVVMKLEQPVWARGVLGFEAVLPAKTSRGAAHSFRLR
jgi:tetratricopeptide (TPR) repeat protein